VKGGSKEEKGFEFSGMKQCGANEVCNNVYTKSGIRNGEVFVRKDGFKLEGGELFKGVFANFSKLE